MMGVLQEGQYAVASHIGGYGECIHLEVLKEATGIHITRIPDITSLSISDDELIWVLLAQVLYGLLESKDAKGPHALIEGEVGLIRHTEVCCGINDSLVERKDGVILT